MSQSRRRGSCHRSRRRRTAGSAGIKLRNLLTHATLEKVQANFRIVYAARHAADVLLMARSIRSETELVSSARKLFFMKVHPALRHVREGCRRCDGHRSCGLPARLCDKHLLYPRGTARRCAISGIPIPIIRAMRTFTRKVLIADD